MNNQKQSQQEGPRLLYDRKEAAHQLSISVRSLDYRIARKELAFRRIGRKILIPYKELVRFAAADHLETVTTARVAGDHEEPVELDRAA